MAGAAPASATGTSEPEEALAALGRALSDPARVRILALLAEGRSCCAGMARASDDAPGADAVCVCELQAVLGMRQSLVSYHLRLLREAGLVREERRGRWSFYRLDRAAVASLAATLAKLAGGASAEAVRSAPARSAPAAERRGVAEMACADKDPTRRPEGGFMQPAADSGCCGETGCCGDVGSGDEASTCCGGPPAEPACCGGCC
ncbi:ArsR/SmtB family transcription factor [Thermaerobacter litoralis]